MLLGHEVLDLCFVDLVAELGYNLLRQVVQGGELLGQSVNVRVSEHLNRLLSTANVNSHVQAFYVA